MEDERTREVRNIRLGEVYVGVGEEINAVNQSLIKE